ncbi:MAG: GNAT family protein [Bacteroidota bacterium]
MKARLGVRPAQLNELSLVVGYFHEADPEFILAMGALPHKLPPKDQWIANLEREWHLPLEKKKLYYLIWEIEGKAVGHCNMNKIEYGKSGSMHLHLWEPLARKKGMGKRLVQLSVAHFFDQFNLEFLICEPYAHNPAPNKTLAKVGFEFVKTYWIVPSVICELQEVNQWLLSKQDYSKMGILS